MEHAGKDLGLRPQRATTTDLGPVLTQMGQWSASAEGSLQELTAAGLCVQMVPGLNPSHRQLKAHRWKVLEKPWRTAATRSRNC